jgi:hypothetical protein
MVKTSIRLYLNSFQGIGIAMSFPAMGAIVSEWSTVDILFFITTYFLA